MGEELCYNKMSVFVEEKSGGKNACSRRGMLTVN